MRLENRGFTLFTKTHKQHINALKKFLFSIVERQLQYTRTEVLRLINTERSPKFFDMASFNQTATVQNVVSDTNRRLRLLSLVFCRASGSVV
jgi:hypothetical protein